MAPLKIWSVRRLARFAVILHAGLTVAAQQKSLKDSNSGMDGNKNPFNADFNSYVNDLLDEWKVAGMSIGVVDGDNVYTRVSHLFMFNT
jgi:hypothetical protein